MEALPRLPMLSFEFRPYYPKNGEFGPDLMKYIREYYHEDPNNYTEEIRQLEKLRQQVMKINKDIDGCNLLKRYFCQLYFLQKRFPMLKDSSNVAEISWKDVITNSNLKKIDYRNEFTVTLYNIGALHTMLGAADDRTTSEGLKLACTHFQCAAWAFTYLQEITSVNVRSDFDPGFLQFLIPVCLAQAQECIAEKSITDNRKPSISVKVVTQICEYYVTAMNALSLLKQEDSIIVDCGMKNSHAWMNYLKFKKPYYESITNLFLGMVAEEEEKMGERVAYYELASEKLKVAFHYFKYIDVLPLNKGLEEALTFTRDIVEGKLRNAVNENEFIFHTTVPPKDSLPKVNGAVLVKCTGFDFNDPDISGPDIFLKLISMKVHELSSRYSEEKAKLLRNISSSVEEKESELNYIMQSFKLDYLSPSEDPNALPEELIERCAACEAKPNLIQDLISLTNKLAESHQEIETMMTEIMTLIKEEEKAEEEYQIIMRTTRPPSIVATDMKCEANRYMEALKTAKESNESLRNAVSAHINNLRILALPLDELEKQLPRVSLDYSPEESNIVKELQRLVDKVEEMKTQRALLMLQLRDSLRNDDITNQLAIADKDESVFSAIVQKEIGKHQNVVSLIEQNLKAQSNILKAITNSYASYAPIRKIIIETAHKRGIQINALIESFDVSDKVLQKTNKGLDFYRKLEANVRKLLTRVKGTCKVQEEERQQMYTKSGRQRGKEKDKFLDVSDVSVSATPKLKDYIAQKQITNRSMNEVSMPYNPYYDNSSSVTFGSSMDGHIDEVRVPYSVSFTNSMNMNQYYANVARPPPVGSETMTGPSPVELSEDTKLSTSAIPSTTVYSNYNYPYYNTTGSYQSLLTSCSSSVGCITSTTDTQVRENVNAYPVSYSASQNGYSANVLDSNFAGYNNMHSGYNTNQTNTVVSQQCVDRPGVCDYNKGFLNYTSYSGPQTPNIINNIMNSSKTEADIQNVYSHLHTNSSGSVYGSKSTYASIAPNFLNTTSSISNCVNTYPEYSRSSAYYTTVNSPQENQNLYVASNLHTACTSPYFSTTSVPSNTYPNAAIAYYRNGADLSTGASVAYTGAQVPVTPASSIFPNAAVAVNDQMTYGVSNTSGMYSTVHGANERSNVQNVYSTSNYYNQPSYTYNVTGTSSYPSNYDACSYTYESTATQLPTESVDSVLSTTVSYVSIGAFTWNSTRYTNAGHHDTQNIESFSKSHDGRSYATQYATNNEVAVSNESGSQYYTQQYGSQCATTEDTNAENFVSREDEQQSNRLQAKRNSMTYMQAGPSASKNTSSTFVNDKNTSTTTSTEGKAESNLDLLADLDFNVSDSPLLPVSETTAAHKILEKLTNLNLIGTSSDKKVIHVEDRIKTVPKENPFINKSYVSRIVQEAEKFEKFVDKLTMKTLNGSIPLDIIWNEYTTQQDKFSRIQPTVEGRKYNDKNRCVNTIPYDSNRVILSSVEPDYINASLIKSAISSAPDIIVTQAPMSSTISDFWCMIWDQEVELIVCLLTDQEIDSGLYWPREKNEKLETGIYVVTLHSINVQVCWTERILSVLKDNIIRVVIHLQLSSWQEELFTEMSNAVTQILDESISIYYAQRDLHHPIVVHCNYGVGRSGIFTLLTAFICDINCGKGIPDIMAMLMLMSEGRKTLIKDKKHLLNTFQLALSYVQGVLVKCGLRSVPDTSKEAVIVKVENACNTETLPDVSAFRKPASKSEIKLPHRLLSKEENKRRNVERFSIGGCLDSVNESMTPMPEDPLSSIDPLWSIKK